jgi:hypothetical protein
LLWSREGSADIDVPVLLRRRRAQHGVRDRFPRTRFVLADERFELAQERDNATGNLFGSRAQWEPHIVPVVAFQDETEKRAQRVGRRVDS